MSKFLLILQSRDRGRAIDRDQLDTANWIHGKRGSESVCFARIQPRVAWSCCRYPSGHVIAPHWHESKSASSCSKKLTLGSTLLNTGAYAYLPSREVQRLSCTSRPAALSI